MEPNLDPDLMGKEKLHKALEHWGQASGSSMEDALESLNNKLNIKRDTFFQSAIRGRIQAAIAALLAFGLLIRSTWEQVDSFIKAGLPPEEALDLLMQVGVAIDSGEVAILALLGLWSASVAFFSKIREKKWTN